MGRVQHEEGEYLGVEGAIALGGAHEEGGALALQQVGGVLSHRPQGSQQHRAPVVQGLHQPGHVHALLQGDELGWRGAQEEGRQ
jgi:hypothetical protein